MEKGNRHISLGLKCMSKELWDEAIAEFRKVIDKDPGSVEAYRQLGVAYSHNCQFENANLFFEKAIQLEPNSAETHLKLGEMYAMQGQWEVTIFEFKEALRLDSDSAEALSNLGWAHNEQGLFDEAIMELKRAIALDPTNYSAHYLLGLSYRAKGNFDDAIAEFRKTLLLDPNNGDGHRELGISYGKKGLHNKESAELKRAIVIDPDDAEAHHQLGIIFYNKGLLNEAIAEFQIVLEIRPDHGDATKMLESIREQKAYHEMQTYNLLRRGRRSILIAFVPLTIAVIFLCASGCSAWYVQREIVNFQSYSLTARADFYFDSIKIFQPSLSEKGYDLYPNMGNVHLIMKIMTILSIILVIIALLLSILVFYYRIRRVIAGWFAILVAFFIILAPLAYMVLLPSAIKRDGSNYNIDLHCDGFYSFDEDHDIYGNTVSYRCEPNVGWFLNFVSFSSVLLAGAIMARSISRGRQHRIRFGRRSSSDETGVKQNSDEVIAKAEEKRP